MGLSISQRRKINNALLIVLAGILISLIYPVFADGFSEILPYINGFFIGLIGGLFVAILELEVFDPAKRKFSFLPIFVLKTSIYFFFFLFIIPIIMGLIESVYYQRGFIEHLIGNQFQRFLYEEDYVIILFYALTFIALIIFTRQMSRKLGQGMLFNFITGKYHQPREVERIFMFLDLRSSTTIAEKLGALEYHNFLRDFFNDITEPIVASKGIIYRYVGDQVVVFWTNKRGLPNGNCIGTYFLVKNHIKKLREKYLEKYQLVPVFTACFHCGNVVVGEIGDVKSQLVFHGEVLYELGEIEKKCRELDQPLLISGNLLQQVSLPALYKMVKVDELKYSENETIDLYSLKEVVA